MPKTSIFKWPQFMRTDTLLLLDASKQWKTFCYWLFLF